MRLMPYGLLCEVVENLDKFLYGFLAVFEARDNLNPLSAQKRPFSKI